MGRPSTSRKRHNKNSKICRSKRTIDNSSKASLNQCTLFDALIMTNETATASSKKNKFRTSLPQ